MICKYTTIAQIAQVSSESLTQFKFLKSVYLENERKCSIFVAKYVLKHEMARLTEYDYNLCVDICESVSLGEHIKDVLDSNDSYPTFPTWCKWKRDNDELFNLYTRSIQDKSEMVIFEINQTMSDLKNNLIDASQARVLIDTYKWLASKYYPKMFGDKVDVTTDGEKIQSTPTIVFKDSFNE